MSDSEHLEFECRRARQAVHEILDEASDGAGAGRLDEHLSSCADCRVFATDMRSLQQALRRLPAVRFPDAALDEVRARTLVGGRPDASRRWRFDWRSFAAAAVLSGAAFGLWQWSRPTDPGAEQPSTVGMIVIDPERIRTDPEYARQITDETRRVLGLTSDALRRTEHAAFRGVLAGRVGTALEKVPIEWPESDTPTEKNRQRENEL